VRDSMGYEINWNANGGDPVLSTPQYQKWSQFDVSALVGQANEIKTDIKTARASRESAAVINYLSWLLRTIALVG
jgi:hypothetical protein